MKRIFSVLFSVLFLLTALPLGAVPVAAATAGITGDCTWTLDDNGHLTISGNGAMGDYVSCGPWGRNITSVIIEDGVTTIGQNAFDECLFLTTAIIGNNVAIIKKSAFDFCYSLTSVNIPDSVRTIEERAFYFCYTLTTISIGKNVTTIGKSAFAQCSQLTTVMIGNKIATIGEEAFYCCESLNAVKIMDLGAWCSINFAEYTSNPLYYADNLYLNGELAEELIIPMGVTAIESHAFINCDTITAVVISDSVTEIGYEAFTSCDNLTTVTIGGSVTIIGDYAFSYCSSIDIVHYHGSKQGYKEIAIGDDNYCILSNHTQWHYYDDVYDTTCNNCNFVRELPEILSSLKGDANGDGKVNVRDLGLLQQYLNGWDVFLLNAVCDVNSDEKVNVRDLGLLQQYLNGWDVELAT